MSRLQTALLNRLTKVQARITEIETEYPDIIRIKSYARDFNATATTYQDFAAVAKEYRDLLNDEERLSMRLDELEGTSGGTSYASFQEPS